MNTINKEKEPTLLNKDEFHIFQEWRAQMQKTSGVESPAELIIEDNDLGNPQ